MKYARIGDLFEIEKGKKNRSVEAPSHDSKRIIGINDLRNDSNIVFTDDRNGVEVFENDILIAWDGANAGTVGYGKEGYVGSTIARMRIKNPKKYNAIFLGKILQSKFDYLKATTTGATIPHLNRSLLENIKIPQIDLSDQIRIANVLTRAEKLIAKRKDSIKALDEFIKSTFLELFGFISGDFKQWQAQPLVGNTEIVSGVTKGKRYGAAILREVAYMRVANVQDGYLNLDEIKTIEVTEDEIERYRLRKGDLLLTEGGDPDKLGRGVVWNNEIDECIHQNHIFRVRTLDENINPVYLCALISSNYGKRYFLKAAKQTTGIASINSTQLKAFPLILPPPPLQKQFAAIVEKVESLKIKYTQSLTELENLYGSLSQRAFKGELDLSAVPIEEPVLKTTSVELEPAKFSMEALGLEVQISTKYSVDVLSKLMAAFGDKAFSFDELWTELEKASLVEMPEYETVKADIFRMLENSKFNLEQTFDMERKEIVMRLKK